MRISLQSQRRLWNRYLFGIAATNYSIQLSRIDNFLILQPRIGTDKLLVFQPRIGMDKVVILQPQIGMDSFLDSENLKMNILYGTFSH